MSDRFKDPGTGGGGDQLNYTELTGALLLLTPKKETDEIDTEYGPNTAIAGEVAVLDGPLKGTVYSDTLIFPRKLKAQLREAANANEARISAAKRLGQTEGELELDLVLGRLGQGEKQPGKNPPWQLSTATDDEKATATKYLAYVATQTERVPVPAPVEEEPF